MLFRTTRRPTPQTVNNSNDRNAIFTADQNKILNKSSTTDSANTDNHFYYYLILLKYTKDFILHCPCTGTRPITNKSVEQLRETHNWINKESVEHFDLFRSATYKSTEEKIKIKHLDHEASPEQVFDRLIERQYTDEITTEEKIKETREDWFKALIALKNRITTYLQGDSELIKKLLQAIDLFEKLYRDISKASVVMRLINGLNERFKPNQDTGVAKKIKQLALPAHTLN